MAAQDSNCRSFRCILMGSTGFNCCDSDHFKGEETEIMILLPGKWYETEFPMQLDQNFF